jgi:hypothetical protein
VQWNTGAVGSKLVTSGVQSFRTTHPSTKKLLRYCGRHGYTGMLTTLGLINILNSHLHNCSSLLQLSSMPCRRHCKATGQAMGTFRTTRARSSAARRWNGSRPPSGSFSGRGSGGPTSFTESGTSAMLTDGVYRLSSASSLGMALCIFYLTSSLADPSDSPAHPSGSPPSSPPTSNPSTHGSSHPCGSPPAS